MRSLAYLRKNKFLIVFQIYSANPAMRTLTEHKGWIIEICSSRHKHFAKGIKFSAHAAMCKRIAWTEELCAITQEGLDPGKEKISIASDGDHCTVDLAEADALARAKAAIDKYESA